MKALGFLFFFVVCFQVKAQNEGIPFTFNPLSVKRDPFLAPFEEEAEVTSELQRYEVAQLQLVGIMQGLGPTKAMVVVPSKKTFIVQLGDAIGRNSGKITKISDTEIFIKESFKDFQGRVRVDTVRLALAL